MKKLYFVLIGFLVFGGVEAQIINFPDANFKAKLLGATSGNSIASTQTPFYVAYNSSYIVNTYNQIDTNNDGEIQISEALAIKYLNINSSSISNLEGIEYFVNLNYLSCSSNQITSLNASVLTNLIYLNCSQNQLPSINVYGLTNLFGLDCSNNHISSLNVSGLVNLYHLYCGTNQITNLDLQGLTILNDLICGQNQLTSLNVSGSPNMTYLSCSENQIAILNINGLINITYLSCSYNQLTNLNISGFNNLQMLSCTNNQLSSLDLGGPINSHFNSLYCYSNLLTSLDVSNLPNITTVFCQNNQLTNLNLKNGNAINSLNFSANPNLQYVCADDDQILSIQNKITSYGYTNCNLNSYCTFTPGGTFYTMQGKSRYDLNGNGCDSLDLSYSFLTINKFVNNNLAGVYLSNGIGNYTLPVQAGVYSFIPVIENPTYFNVSPTTATVTFPSTTSPYIQDFCITANGTHNDLEITLLPIGLARPGFDAHYQIVYKNKGTNTQSGSVNLTFNDAVLDYVSAIPTIDVQTLNNLTWNFSNLAPFESKTILVTLNLNSPLETPPLNLGDVLNYTATINGLTDETPTDNTSVLNQIVVNALDPNYKTCTEGATVAPNMAGKYVHYMIGFENTGTANAQNIVVKDIIDTTKYDVTTLVPIKGSADFTTRITNTNQVEFIFQNINLPFTTGSNDGYVAFKIKTKPTLVVGDTFSNTANIYFDYNAPIVTNTATTTIAALANPTFVFSDYFTLSPVPAKDILNITSKQESSISSISIYNTLGQLMSVTSNPSTAIDVSNLAIGSYFIKVLSDKGTSSVEFIKE